MKATKGISFVLLDILRYCVEDQLDFRTYAPAFYIYEAHLVHMQIALCDIPAPLIYSMFLEFLCVVLVVIS